MAQPFESLSPRWEALTPGFGVAQPWLLWVFRESTSG